MKELDKKILKGFLVVLILCSVTFCAIYGVKQVAYFFGVIMVIAYLIFLISHIALLAPSVAVLLLCSILIENKVEFILDKSLILGRLIKFVLVSIMYFTILFAYTYLMFMLVKFDFKLVNYWEFITTIFE